MKVSIKLALAALIMLLITTNLSYGKDAALEKYEKGLKYAAQGNSKEADKAFSETLKKDPDFSSAEDALKIIRDLRSEKIGNDTAIHIFKGVLSVYKKKYSQGFKDFAKAIESDPVYADAYFCRANSYDDMGRYDLAIKDYSKAIMLDPGLANAYNNRGVIYRHKKMYDLAIKDYTKAIELDPEDAVAFSNRGIAYRHKKQYTLAIRDYNKAIEINPKYATAYSNRGLTFRNMKKYDLALQDYNKAIKLNLELANAFYNRGSIYFARNQYDLAVKDYTKTIKIDPRHIGAYNNRGVVYYLKLGSKKKACADFKRSCDLGDCKNYNAARRNGDCRLDTAGPSQGQVPGWEDYENAIEFAANGKLKEAKEAFEKALKYGPAFFAAENGKIVIEDLRDGKIRKNTAIHIFKGALNLNRAQYDQALQNYTKAIKINPEYARAYNARGVVHKVKKQYDLAIKDYTKAIKINPRYDNVYNNRGNAYRGIGQHDQAIKDYTKAIKINPKFADAYNGRGNAYQDKGQYDLAIKDYSKAIKINPRYDNAYENRGIVYFRYLGDRKRGCSDWKRACELGDCSKYYAAKRRGYCK